MHGDPFPKPSRVPAEARGSEAIVLSKMFGSFNSLKAKSKVVATLATTHIPKFSSSPYDYFIYAFSIVSALSFICMSFLCK